MEGLYYPYSKNKVADKSVDIEKKIMHIRTNGRPKPMNSSSSALKWEGARIGNTSRVAKLQVALEII